MKQSSCNGSSSGTPSWKPRFLVQASAEPMSRKAADLLLELKGRCHAARRKMKVTRKESLPNRVEVQLPDENHSRKRMKTQKFYLEQTSRARRKKKEPSLSDNVYASIWILRK